MSFTYLFVNAYFPSAQSVYFLTFADNALNWPVKPTSSNYFEMTKSVARFFLFQVTAPFCSFFVKIPTHWTSSGQSNWKRSRSPNMLLIMILKLFLFIKKNPHGIQWCMYASVAVFMMFNIIIRNTEQPVVKKCVF